VTRAARCEPPLANIVREFLLGSLLKGPAYSMQCRNRGTFAVGNSSCYVRREDEPGALSCRADMFNMTDSRTAD
jgi:hypothetical protein